MPATFDWHFHLNELFSDGLREQGLLGLVWAMGQLQQEARYSFFYCPPIEILHPSDQRSLGDVDIACAIDGLFTVGEVKESARYFNQAVADELVERSIRFRADRAVLACLDRDALGTLQALVATMQPKLDDTGCRASAIVPDGRFGTLNTLSL